MSINRRVKLLQHESSIRAWTRDGMSDSWIASALGSSPSSVQSFRSRRGIFKPLWEPDLSEAEDFEGTVEHDEGEGVWLDPAVADSRAWSSWQGVEGVTVRVSAGRITILPA